MGTPDVITNKKVCGLFAGIGGLELGLHKAGFQTSALCEIDPAASAVLRHRFPEAVIHADIERLGVLPETEIVTAGFPCQDLSMAGYKSGIKGRRSSLVMTMFNLLRKANVAGRRPRWLVVENVPYMLHLRRGEAMKLVTDELSTLGYQWAYRVVDARAFGVPQRRLRVILVASPTEDPRRVLFAGNHDCPSDDSTDVTDPSLAYGFYWTEGKRGLGWTVDGVPTIKGGSTIGIPSPPAIWIRESGDVGTPDIRDLERLQGFPAGWTIKAARREEGGSRSARWRLVGNAVCAKVAAWLGLQLRDGGRVWACKSAPISALRWPNAASGGPGIATVGSSLSSWPVHRQRKPLRQFLRYQLKPLSYRASAGYLNRASQATALNFPDGFLEAIHRHALNMADDSADRDALSQPFMRRKPRQLQLFIR
jgi:DNA (cytosine-5)-methyltransferase 1